MHYRFALLSHILPPSPSGQAVMLYRILSGFAPEEYYLISREKYEPRDASKSFLAASYHTLSLPRLIFWLNKRSLGFLWDILTVILSVFFRAREIIKIMRFKPADVLVACSGDVVDIPAGFIASSILGIPFVVYAFDDYVHEWTGSYGLSAHILGPFVFRRCDGVIGTNEFICAEYRQRYGVECALVRNPGDQETFEKSVYSNWPFEEGKITIMYTGAIYHANYECFQNLICAITDLQDPRVELHIFTSQTGEQIMEQGIGGEHVSIHSHVSYTDILKYQRTADILFLPLAFNTQINEVIRTSAPGKLAEYLASGRPVLAHVPANSFVAHYLKKNQCGLVASENDPASLKTHVLQLIRDEDFRSVITYNARQRARLDFHPQLAREAFADFLLHISTHRNHK